jgi:hypothetical protein
MHSCNNHDQVANLKKLCAIMILAMLEDDSEPISQTLAKELVGRQLH